MSAAPPRAAPSGGVQDNRAFILGSLSVGHGLSHMFDQGYPLLITEIAAAMGLGNFRTAALFAVRQAGASATSLGGGPITDHLKTYWGLILTACMLGHALTFALIGGAPGFAYLVVITLLLSVPGSLWHLPSAAAISQRFPDRRGFAISMHGFGSNIGNVSGPVLAGALLATGFLIWRHIFFIYAGFALLMAVFVWWSLRGLGRRKRRRTPARQPGAAVRRRPDSAEKPHRDGADLRRPAAGHRPQRPVQLDAFLPAGNPGDGRAARRASTTPC